ncbi:MAG: ATP-binding protein, partial [Candidatus Dojkabacteria bacterium]
MDKIGDTINRLFELQEDLLREFQEAEIIEREIYSAINYDNHATGVIGLRGVGKTTLLLRESLINGAISRESLYISADDIAMQDFKLIDIVEFLYKQLGIKKVYVDEIHKYENWMQELKNIADRYAEMKVVFTSSSAIDLIHSKYDLSRRVSFINLPGLSFREYLYFKHQISIPKCELEDIISNPAEANTKLLNAVAQPLAEMNNYLESGYYPF